MNFSSKRILPGVRLFMALTLLVAANGFVFAQTEATTTTTVPAAPAPAADAAPAVPAAQPAAPAPAAKDFFADAPAADRQAIAAADDLAAKGKWLSAWTALSAYDAANANPFILAKKINIAMEGYASTSAHLSFGFVDLTEGQDLETIRESGAEIANPVDFKPGDLAKAIEDKGEAVPPVLSMALGDYYYTVWKTYQGQWAQDDATILAACAENYERAVAYEAYTLESLGKQADVLMALERFDGAEAVVKKALEIAPEDYALTLKLADVYFATKKYNDVYPLADKVVAASEDPNEVNNGYIAAIKAGLAANDKDTLEKYVSAFEKRFPTEYVPGLIRHVVAVQLGDAAGADAAADAVTAAFPGNPDVIRSIISTWLSANDFESGFKYLDRSIAKKPADDAMAALYFYQGLLHAEAGQSVDNLNLALASLDTAESYFKKTYPETHQVFQMIGELRTQWNEALKAAQSTSQATTQQATTPAAAPAADQSAAAAPATTTTTTPAAAPAATTEPAATDATTAATN